MVDVADGSFAAVLVDMFIGNDIIPQLTKVSNAWSLKVLSTRTVTPCKANDET